MKRLLSLGVVLALALPALAMAAPTFPPLTGRVVDNANLLSPAAERNLDGELAALEQQTGPQLVVATLADLQGYEIADYGYQLGRAWRIGRSGPDDGAILIVAAKERAVRIEVGYGLEPVLTDALSSLIIQRKIVPAFKAGRMEQGIVEGTAAIAAQIGLPADEARAAALAAEQPQVRILRPERSGGGVPIGVVLIVLFFVASGVMRAFGGRRRGRGGGGGLWWLLPMLLSSGGRGGGGGWSGGGGGGGFSGGGGSFGGGGSSGGW